MPDVFDNGLPPEIPQGFAPPRPTAPQAPAPAPRRPDKPKEQAKTPEIPLAATERARPPALVQKKIKGEQRWVLAPGGVMGDLDERGLDYLAGYIAMVNGVGFAGAPAHKHKNPGGFGITLWPSTSVTAFHLLPRQGGPAHAPWMATLYEDLHKARPNASLADVRGDVRPVSFPSWKDGGDALLSYLQLISASHIPYFYHGPMTPIADVLLCFDAPFASEQMFGWTDLLEVLTAHETRTQAAKPIPGSAAA